MEPRPFERGNEREQKEQHRGRNPKQQHHSSLRCFQIALSL